MMTLPSTTAISISVALLAVVPLPIVAAADDAPVRGEATAVCVEKGPACDGTLNDPLWEKCPRWPLGACTSADPQKYKTWAKVLIDATHVHATLFGDSLTAATSYPQCAQSAFGTLTVNAFGYPSMRTSFGRGKVGEILEKDNPEFMFILYGTNNNKSEQHIPAAMEDLAAIVMACEKRGTVAFLGTIPPRGWTPESAPEAKFNRHLVELCRSRRIPAGYIFETFQTAGERRKYMGNDGVHWQGTGMALAARTWAAALNEIRFVIRDRD